MDFFRKKYSEDKIRSYVLENNCTRLEWDFISCYQDLSDDFIREFSDKVHWYGISRHQVLSKKFKYEMHDRFFIKDIKTSDNPKEVL